MCIDSKKKQAALKRGIYEAVHHPHLTELSLPMENLQDPTELLCKYSTGTFGPNIISYLMVFAPEIPCMSFKLCEFIFA